MFNQGIAIANMVKIANSNIRKSLEFINQSKLSDAVLLLRKVLRTNPKEIQALNIIGQILLEQKDYSGAIEYLGKSLKINSNDYDIWARLGYAYEKANYYDNAISAFRRSLELNPKQANVYDCIGRVLAKGNKDYEALPYFFKALEYDPNNADIHNNIGFTSKKLGLYEMTIKHYQVAKTLDPNNGIYLSSLIFNVHKDPQKGFQDFHKHGKEFYERFVEPTKGGLGVDIKARLNITKTKLRLGFVSADLCQHPVSAYLIKVLEKINRQDFELFVYSNNEHQDAITERIKASVSKFTLIDKLEDIQAAEIIANDEIDVLFDLSGFTKGARLGIFKIKPAPVQITHIGYFGTLAMPEIDFLIADENLIRTGEEKYFTEKIYKIPNCYCHCALYDMPEANKELPYDRNGYITFGSTNSFHKISTDVIALWTKLLKEVPNSKMLFDALVLGSKHNQNYVSGIFTRNGIDSSRLILRSSGPRQDFLNSYNDIDISLDPFPYGGGTTTIESLMMGVPVVTINGDRWVSRQSTGFLQTVGHPELVATDINDYLSKAKELAADTARLRSYRTNLRTDMQNSELNIDKYVPKFEQAIKDMWQIICKENLE